MSIQNNFPTIKPTLLLDFANTEQLDPRITFTRASTATYYGTQTAKAEENLLIRSQEFDNIYFAKQNTTITANATTAPDGTSTSDEMFETATTAEHRIGVDPVTVLSSTTYTYSVFAKKNTRDWLILNFVRSGAANFRVWFDLNTGVVGTTTAGVTASISSVGNGWYRCSIVKTTNAAETNSGFYIGVADADNSFSYAGDITKSIYIWGAQVEQRSAVTAYTPTTTVPITNYIPQMLTAASGVPRFDHNPITFESLGLEIEEQRTNLLTYSEMFADAAWTKTNASVTANTIVSPDGALTGDKLVENTANGFHLAQSATITPTASTLYTFTCYAKAAERTQVSVAFTGGGSADSGVIFNLLNGTYVATIGVAPNSYNIISVGNGWYRCSITWATTNTNAIAGRVYSALSSAISYTGDGTSGIYIWGAQLEAGAFPTSYIPTVASQVTRAADLAAMTGTNFSSWYNQSEGTVYAEYARYANIQGRIATISNNTLSNQIRLNGSVSTNIRPDWQVLDGGTVQVNVLGVNTIAPNVFAKSAGAYAANSFNQATNAVLGIEDTGGTVPIVSQMNIGSNEGGASIINGTIKKIAYYPMRVTNAQLQGLTS